MNFTSVHVWRAYGGFRVTLSDTRVSGRRPTTISSVLDSVNEALKWLFGQIESGAARPVDIDEIDLTAAPGINLKSSDWILKISVAWILSDLDRPFCKHDSTE